MSSVDGAGVISTPAPSLDTLPNEIKVMITLFLSDDPTSCRALALSSRSFLAIAIPIFYKSGNFAVYRSALQMADVDMLERCSYFNAAPLQLEFHDPRNLPQVSSAVQINALTYFVQFHLPNSYVAHDAVAIQDCAEWLLEQEGDYTTPLWFGEGHADPLPHLVELLVLTYENPTRTLVQDLLIDIIRMIHESGGRLEWDTPGMSPSLKKNLLIWTFAMHPCSDPIALNIVLAELKERDMEPSQLIPFFQTELDDDWLFWLASECIDVEERGMGLDLFALEEKFDTLIELHVTDNEQSAALGRLQAAINTYRARRLNRSLPSTRMLINFSDRKSVV